MGSEDRVQNEPYADRCRRLTAALHGLGLGGLLVTSPVNVRYLSGFTGSNGAVLVSGDGVTVATDGRYVEQAERETGLAPLVTRGLLRALVGRAIQKGVDVLGVERDVVTIADFDVISEAAGALRLSPRSGLVEAQRVRKDATELAALRRAAAIADAAFAAMLDDLRPGVSEHEVAVALEESMRRLGAQAPAFATIVAAGPNGSEPHHRPTDYVIAAGDLVTVDMGALVDGYHSDMTRTVAVGSPSGWQRELYGVVEAAQRAGIAAVTVGAPAAAVDAAARAVIDEAGYGDRFPHGVGHGVGLQIHEAPMLFGAGDVTLAECMVVTVEPGIYLPGRGGVRIEDTVVVGSGEVLTRASYDPILTSPGR
jgi:Xaa-Pro dipeptidase